MRPLIVIRHIPNIDFMGWRKVGFALSAVLTIGSIVLFLMQGLNFGIDFAGGTQIDARSLSGPADLAGMRAKLDSLGLGQIALQNFGSPEEVLIRVPRQPGSDQNQMVAVSKVQAALGKTVEYRSIAVVGPTVGNELIRAGILATVLALLAIAAYVWFRFEWPFGVGAMLSTLHDTLTTVGLFALLQIEFNLTTLAAILTIAGYSVNDTVVIYDRVRESMQRHKSMSFGDLINLALNETLSRTILTVGTVALAVLSLLIFGGEVLRGFSIAMLWGVVIGTYSSLFIAAPVIYYIRPKRTRGSRRESEPREAARPTARAIPSSPRPPEAPAARQPEPAVARRPQATPPAPTQPPGPATAPPDSGSRPASPAAAKPGVVAVPEIENPAPATRPDTVPKPGAPRSGGSAKQKRGKPARRGR